jgi:hypothetical protein
VASPPEWPVVCRVWEIIISHGESGKTSTLPPAINGPHASSMGGPARVPCRARSSCSATLTRCGVVVPTVPLVNEWRTCVRCQDTPFQCTQPMPPAILHHRLSRMHRGLMFTGSTSQLLHAIFTASCYGSKLSCCAFCRMRPVHRHSAIGSIQSREHCVRAHSSLCSCGLPLRMPPSVERK